MCIGYGANMNVFKDLIMVTLKLCISQSKHRRIIKKLIIPDYYPTVSKLWEYGNVVTTQ